MKDITFYTVIGGGENFRESAALGVDAIIRKNPDAKRWTF